MTAGSLSRLSPQPLLECRQVGAAGGDLDQLVEPLLVLDGLHFGGQALSRVAESRRLSALPMASRNAAQICSLT